LGTRRGAVWRRHARSPIARHIALVWVRGIPMLGAVPVETPRGLSRRMVKTVDSLVPEGGRVVAGVPRLASAIRRRVGEGHAARVLVAEVFPAASVMLGPVLGSPLGFPAAVADARGSQGPTARGSLGLTAPALVVLKACHVSGSDAQRVTVTIRR
jgi:hypothetical protein